MSQSRAVPLVDRIQQCLKAQPQGMTQEQLQGMLASVAGVKPSPEEMQMAMNRMLANKQVDIMQDANKTILFVYTDPEETAKMKGLTPEETLVFQEISRSGNKGIWQKDLSRSTNLATKKIQGIVQTLENRKLIKQIKAVQGGNKKIYMKYDLTPAKEITGGAWYQGQQLDAELISVLRRMSQRRIQEKPSSSLEEIAEFIRSTKVLNADMSDDDIKMIINTLIYDCQVEATERPDGEEGFRSVLVSLPLNGAFTSIPCGVCPIITECHPGGAVSPASCSYYREWLDF